MEGADGVAGDAAVSEVAGLVVAALEEDEAEGGAIKRALPTPSVPLESSCTSARARQYASPQTKRCAVDHRVSTAGHARCYEASRCSAVITGGSKLRVSPRICKCSGGQAADQHAVSAHTGCFPVAVQSTSRLIQCISDRAGRPLVPLPLRRRPP